MDDLLLREEVYAIVGAAVEVHRELGVGFLEAVYQEAMEKELSTRNIPFWLSGNWKFSTKGNRFPSAIYVI